MEDAGHIVRVAGDHHLAVVTPDSRAGDRAKLAALLDELYAQGRRSSLIFVPADILTATVYALLNERGVVPGREVELVSCNNELLFLRGLYPHPAVIDIGAEAIGRRAVQQLMWRLNNLGEAFCRTLISPRLVLPAHMPHGPLGRGPTQRPGKACSTTQPGKEDHAYERMTARRHADGLLA